MMMRHGVAKVKKKKSNSCNKNITKVSEWSRGNQIWYSHGLFLAEYGNQHKNTHTKKKKKTINSLRRYLSIAWLVSVEYVIHKDLLTA